MIRRVARSPETPAELGQHTQSSVLGTPIVSVFDPRVMVARTVTAPWEDGHLAASYMSCR